MNLKNDVESQTAPTMTYVYHYLASIFKNISFEDLVTFPLSELSKIISPSLCLYSEELLFSFIWRLSKQNPFANSLIQFIFSPFLPQGTFYKYLQTQNSVSNELFLNIQESFKTGYFLTKKKFNQGDCFKIFQVLSSCSTSIHDFISETMNLAKTKKDNSLIRQSLYSTFSHANVNKGMDLLRISF
jgi:hypothetical protein